MQEPADPQSSPETFRAPSDDELDRFEEDLASVAEALEALEADDLESAEAVTEFLSGRPAGDVIETGENSAAHDAPSGRTGDDPD